MVREIIQESKLPFEINDPEGLALFGQFQLKLTHCQTQEEIDFGDLSSGEKVLLSLAFYLFSSREKNTFPKLLLLDEPDAHLHPSMSKQFLDVVKNILVDKYGVQVIMTTHSPSTVILAPNDAIYEMAFDKPRIRKSSSKSHLCVSPAELLAAGTVDSEVPLIFIPASTKTSTGGKNVVAGWVEKFARIRLIDGDNGNPITRLFVFSFGRVDDGTGASGLRGPSARQNVH